MAAATFESRIAAEPSKRVCPSCTRPVLVVAVAVLCEGERLPEREIVAEPWEWEPRARCYICATVETRGKHRERCDRCAGTGYVGQARPPGPMLAIDVAWSDEGHVRVVGPHTRRRKGEALHCLHLC